MRRLRCNGLDYNRLQRIHFGGIAGRCRVCVKHSFERWLDARLKTTEECNRAIVAEPAQREATIFDEQVKACRSACTAVYAARNFAFKTLQQMSESEANSDPSDELDQSYLTIGDCSKSTLRYCRRNCSNRYIATAITSQSLRRLRRPSETEVSPADRISELKNGILGCG